MVYAIAFVAVFSAAILISDWAYTFLLWAVYRLTGGKMTIVDYFRRML